MKTMIMAAAVVAGCMQTMDIPGQICPGSAPDARYLCVGMEVSKRFGSCPGCRSDAERLSALMSRKYGYKGDTLISDAATKEAVVAKLRKGIENTPENGLFLFFYSGHGGQEWLGGKEPDGADAPDEYLCLYDAHMPDDEIWEIVSRCRGRVFLYFDACHSATMYRSVASDRKVGKRTAVALSVDDFVRSGGFTFRPERFMKAKAMSIGVRGPSPRLLCWSGCREMEYSYGDSLGGMLTKAVVGNWRQGLSYGDLWSRAVAAVSASQAGQNPVQTFVGEGFSKDMEAFR